MSAELKAHVLSDIHMGLIKTADADVAGALIALGEAYLHHQQALAVLRQAEEALSSCEQGARKAELNKARVMDKLSTELELPDGRYRYDPETNTLVRGIGERS